MHFKRESSAMPHRCIKLLLNTMRGIVLWWCALAPAHAATGAYTYQIAATMMMPHLDEMRRQVTQQSRCVKDDVPGGLFPVMEQHALRGCRLAYPKSVENADGRRREYVLVCANARVASGTASIDETGQRLVGMLVVKMGGKNMTFSQRVEARRGAACTPPA